MYQFSIPFELNTPSQHHGLHPKTFLRETDPRIKVMEDYHHQGFAI